MTSPRRTWWRAPTRSRTGLWRELATAISNLLRLGRPKNALRSEEKNQDQRRKNEGVTVRGECVREKGDQEDLAEPKDVGAQNGARNRAESPDDGRHERLQNWNKSHVVFDAADTG